MLPGLNYDEKDPRFILLGKVFKFVENEKAKDIFNRNGVKNRSMFLICLKIFFMQTFFSYTISEIINELERSRKLRIFTGIHEVPKKDKFMNFLTDMNQIATVNSKFITKTIFKAHKRRKNSYITDATPVSCDINTLRKYITEDQLKKLRLK